MNRLSALALAAALIVFVLVPGWAAVVAELRRP